MYVPSRKAAQQLGLHPNTLRKFADNGTLPHIKTPSGQRLYDVVSYGQSRVPEQATICYCRVSSHKQKDDLARQVVWMREKFPQAEIIKDISSGLNFKRKGLLAILDRLLQGAQLQIVVAHRDRIARFGFDLFRYIVERSGGEILVLDSKVHSPEQELTADLLAILHVFSCRMHGLRRYRNEIKEDSALSDTKTNPDIS